MPLKFRQGLFCQKTSKNLVQCFLLSLCLTICLGIISAIKERKKSKGMPEFSPELCGKMWVPVMDHIVRQAKLSDNTLEKQLCNLFGAQLTSP